MATLVELEQQEPRKAKLDHCKYYIDGLLFLPAADTDISVPVLKGIGVLVSDGLSE
jgi:hypothetical protein